MKWVSYRYGFHKSNRSPQGARAGGARNRLTLTWAGLLNLTGERLPPATCKTCATLVVAVGQMYRSVGMSRQNLLLASLSEGGLASPQDL
jgi:hypothetical protein